MSETTTESIDSTLEQPPAPVAAPPVFLNPLETQTARRVACEAFEACKGDELTFAYLCLKDPRVIETKDGLRDAFIVAMKAWFAKWTSAAVEKPTAIVE